MCTFADALEPRCVSVLRAKGLRFEKYFNFNNCALFTSNVSDSVVQSYWKMGMDSMGKFLEYAMENSDVPVSLASSREVLLTRELMMQKVDLAKERVQNAFSTLERSTQIQTTILQNKEAIEAGKDITTTYTGEQLRFVEFDEGETRYQYCGICNQLCCQICAWPEGAVKSPCTYFDAKKYPQHRGMCPICPSHCSRDDHVRPDRKPIRETVTEEIIIPGKKKALDDATSSYERSKGLLSKEKEVMDLGFEAIMADISILQESQKKLEEISLFPGMFAQIDLFQEMIAAEEKTKQPGWQNRVSGIKMAMEKLELIKMLTTASSVSDLFPQYQEVLNFMSAQ